MSHSFRDLTVFKKAFALAMEIYEISNHMIENPEKYLTNEDKKKLTARLASK